MNSINIDKSFVFRVSKLALPVAIQMLLQSVLGMADVIMVSGLGAAAIAAVGLSAKLHFLLLVVMMGIATGCSILVAQYTGAKDTTSGNHTLAVTLLVGTVVMVPGVMLFGIDNQWWLSILNPDKDVIVLAARYLLITALALLLTQWIVIFEAALRATGNTILPLITGAIAAISNIILNYILIFGHFGFPELGVAGAAWGTMLSRILQAAIIILWLAIKKHPFSPLRLDYLYALSLKRIKKFLIFSLPLISNYLIWAVGNATYHVLTGYSGTHALAVMGIIVPVETAFFALFIGTASASAVMIGHALGAEDKEEAWKLYHFFDRLTLALVILLSLILWLCSPFLISGFAGADKDTAELLNQTLLVFCALTWLKVVNMQRIIGVLRAGADNNFVLLTDTLVMWTIGIPIFAVCLFYFHLPFIILYLLMYLEDTAKFLPIRLRIGKRIWLKNLTH